MDQGEFTVQLQRRKVSLKQNFKSSRPSSHYKFPLVICSVWYPAGLTQILWFMHFKLFLLKHFVHSYLKPSIGKLGFILEQEVPASTENIFMWYSQKEIVLIKKNLVFIVFHSAKIISSHINNPQCRMLLSDSLAK